MKVLLTGPPGAGKSTVLVRFVGLAREAGILVAGILTREVRRDDRRVGFELEDLGNGSRALLAHVESASSVRVGRYGVDVACFARLGLPALTVSAGVGVVVVDEIASMAMACPGFSDRVVALLDGPVPVVASIHERPGVFTDALKARPDVRVLRVEPATRDRVAQELLVRLTSR